MPNMNCTGPAGQGPMTGRMAGNCTGEKKIQVNECAVRGRGMGRGKGRVCAPRCGAGMQGNIANLNREMLEKRKEMLKKNLDDIEKQLNNL